MKFHSLSIQAFRSFRGDEVLHFPESPDAFILVSGQNLLEPTLGANDVGKTTLWSALTWCLFGKTERGVTGKSVLSWDSEDLCSVFLEFEVRGILYTLLRTASPNTLVLTEEGQEEGRGVTQGEVDALVGCDFTTFLSTCFMSQFGRFFFDLSPAEKLQLFSDALCLDVWIKASDTARSTTKEHQRDLADAESKHSRLQGRLEESKKRLKEATKAAAAWEDERASRLKKHDADVASLDAEIDDACARVDKLALRAKKRDKLIRAAQKRLEPIESRLKRLTASANDARSGRGGIIFLKQEVSDLEEAIEETEELGRSCPTCEQTITEARKAKIKAALEKSLSGTRAALSSKQEQYARLKKLIDDDEAELGELLQEKKELEGQRDKLARDCARGADAVANLERLLESAQERRRELAEQANPHQTVLDRLSTDIESFKSGLEEAAAAVHDLKERLDRAEYWVKGFRDVRLWLVEQALAEFEILANNSMHQLGLEGWQLSFEAERTTTEGKVTRGFNVSVYSPGSEDPVPWANLGGGVTQRLRIAGAVGFAALVSSRRGFWPSIEVWDEPTAHLSQDGVADLMQFFALRARESGRQVWVVDHRSLESGDFSDEVIIRKDDKGSHIIQTGRATR